MKRKAFSLIMAICMLLAIIPITAMAGTTITMVTVDQLELPSIGKKPDTTAVAVKRSDRKASNNVYVSNVNWEGELDANGCFKANVKYKVTVTLKTKNGAVFSENAFKKGYRTENTLIVGSLSPTATSIDTSKCYWCYVKSRTNDTLVYYFTFSPLADSGKSELNEINEVKEILAANWDSYNPPRSVECDDVVAWAQALVPKDYSVKLSAYLWNKDNYAADDEICNFTIQFKMTAGSTVINSKAFGKNILPEKNTDSDKSKLLEDREAVRDAVSDGTFSNISTEAEILKLIQGACTNGSTVELTKWGKKDADYTAAGYIRAAAKMTLGSESVTFDLPDGKIPMLIRAIPAGMNISAGEWDAIRFTNNERITHNSYPVFIVDFMQNVSELRAAELTRSYSHTRPDGKGTFTVFEDLGYSYNSSASENIGKNVSAEGMVKSWMYSTDGHRENLLNTKWTYMGLSCEYNNSERCDFWAQLFTCGPAIKSWNTGSGKTAYADKYALEQDYLILSMADGKTAYMPLDLTTMTKTSNGYSIALDANTTASFTVRYEDASEPQAEPKTDFVDVPAGSFYEDAVVWAVERGFTKGTSDTTFSPDLTCTRATVVTLLWRAKGEEEPTTTKNPFTDVKETDWYYKAVLWAVEQGITKGTGDTTFSPNTTCSTAQILTFIYRGLDEPTISYTNSLYKTYKGKYYAEALAWADSLKMIDGLAVGFNPESKCTRADTVYYLYKGADSPTAGDYIDWSWSKWSSDSSQW